MTAITDELKNAANERGFGSGKRLVDRLAAIAEIKDDLPARSDVLILQARTNDGGFLIPMAHFGNSQEDANDWGLYHDGTDYISECKSMGVDARIDAKIIAAIVNAYAHGILVRIDK